MEAIRLRSLIWMFTGVGLAVVVLVLFQAWSADAAGSAETTLVPTTPCRLMDTRADGADNVGPRATPIGASETYALQVTGTNGDCTIPAGAVGIAMNVTTLNATAPSFLQLWPADEAQPVRGSSLNYLPGQAPTPNKVDVKLSATGKVSVFNRNGTVDVIADVVGYYTNVGLSDIGSRLAALEAKDAVQDAKVAALEADVTALEADVTALETKLASVSNVTVDGQPTVRFTGVNVQIVDGSGDTGGDVNGKGNLIVGYNENDSDDRTGSHNVVAGVNQSYSSYSGIIGGLNNTASGAHTLMGGYNNTASGFTSSATGGFGSTASGQSSAVSGGGFGTAIGSQSSISGGSSNQATLDFASVSGGIGNIASGTNSAVAGGNANTASGTNSSVTGGNLNLASGQESSVTGGFENEASGLKASVDGGWNNTASATHSTVSGGFNRTAADQDDWVGGSLTENF